MTNGLESLLRQDRRIVLVALLLVAAASWAWLLSGAGMGMTAFEMTRHSMMPMPWMEHVQWTPGYAVLMFFMWWIMMIAMMIPSATPVILLAAALNRRSESTVPPYGSTASFTAGYLVVWALFSLLAVLTQWALERSGWITPMLVSANDLFTGVVLLAAGLWQFSPWKQACLAHCRAPVDVLTHDRRPGNLGAFMMGFRHGAFCLGCCWFLMILLFVGGVMNLYWIIGLAIYVWIEKAAVAGIAVSRVVGIALIGWGLWLIGAKVIGAS